MRRKILIKEELRRQEEVVLFTAKQIAVVSESIKRLRRNMYKYSFEDILQTSSEITAQRLLLERLKRKKQWHRKKVRKLTGRILGAFFH